MLSISTVDWVKREEKTIDQPYQIEIQWCLYTRISYYSWYKTKPDWKLVVHKIVYIMWEQHNLWDIYITAKKVKVTLKEILETAWLI